MDEMLESTPVTSIPINSMPVESAPIATAPMESTPVESAPIESAPIESAPIESAPIESGAVTLAPSAMTEGHTEGPWTSAGVWVVLVLVALLAAAVGAAAGALVMGRRKRAVASVQASREPQVGKLHCVGDRESQQDCFSVSPEDLYQTHGILAAVADGMGGLEDGDQVSQTAVAAVMNAFYALPGEAPQQLLLKTLYAANGAVNHLLGVERIGQCGSTLVLGLLKDGSFHFLSVGDSRICLYRDGILTQLNREHNYERELELRAVNGEGTLEEAKTHPRAAGLTSYLGMGQLKLLDQPSAPVEVRPGDRFLLMSDGVYNALTGQELCQALALEAQAAADAIGQAIAEKHWPGQDNYTAVILQC